MPDGLDTAHDWAAWLLANLLDQQDVGGGVLSGRLADTEDFDAVVTQIDSCDRALLGIHNRAARTIEFNPASGMIFASLDEMLSTSTRRAVPRQFTLRNIGYVHGSVAVPSEVAGYIAAVGLWDRLRSLADFSTEVPPVIHFIKSPDAKLEISTEFSAEDVATFAGSTEFDRDFVLTDLHKEQKRNIVRSTLVSMFAKAKRIELGELIRKFSVFYAQVRASYAIFAADFSYEKIRGEVDKQNFDDTLRLNKTLSEIQNQLLAIPAAMILAGAGIQPDATLKNVVILAGVTLFCYLMMRLIANQKDSVSSIAAEVEVRKQRLAEQPPEVASKFSEAFANFEVRAKKQQTTLMRLRWVVLAVWGSAAIVIEYTVLYAGASLSG